MSTDFQRVRLEDADRSAAWKLWHWNFPCQVRTIHETPEWASVHYGTPSSGDAAIDAQMMSNYQHVILSIIEIAIRVSQGIEVIITNVNESVIIYDLISKHLADWTDSIDRGGYNRKIPYEQLLALDDLAKICYRKAKPFIKDQVGISHSMAKLSQMILSLGNNRRMREEAILADDHHSAASVINKAVLRNKRQWE